MKSILLYANEDAGLNSRLEAALDLAEADEAHLTCIQVTPYDDFVMGDPFGGVYALPSFLEAIEEKQSANRARVEERLRRAQVPWTWFDYTGEPAALVVDRSRLADIIVVSLPNGSERRPGRALSFAADVAVHARALTLAVPPECEGFEPAGRALVAWNGSPESSQAVRLALPLLKRAAAVDILTVVGDEEDEFPATQACEYLAHYGVRPELHERPQGGRSVAECILEEAGRLGSDYIVMGAYGHSRIREAVLGGVTRTMLDNADRPLLLAH
jgi:nucleotide-binding universal stress UspA family protein